MYSCVLCLTALPPKAFVSGENSFQVFQQRGATRCPHGAYAGPAPRPDAKPDTPERPDEHRVALVIGNASYKDSPLKNPVNDARAVAAKLRGLGFDVVERHTLSQRQIGRTLSEFRGKLTPGGTALFFYAGHGLQVEIVSACHTGADGSLG